MTKSQRLGLSMVLLGMSFVISGGLLGSLWGVILWGFGSWKFSELKH